MLAQSLFAAPAPVAPEAIDGAAAPASDGAFGRMVDEATAEGTSPPPEAGVKAKPNGQGPQILPDVPQPKQMDGPAPPRPLILPSVPDEGAATAEGGDDVAVVPPAPPEVAGEAEADGEPRREILPVEIGPEAEPRREVLPIVVGPIETPRRETLPPETGGSDGDERKAAIVTPLTFEAPRPTPSAEVDGNAAVASAGSGSDASTVQPEPSPTPTPTPAPDVVTATTKTARPAAPAQLEAPAAPRGDLSSFMGHGEAPTATPVDGAPPAPAPVATFGLSRVAHETLAELTAQVVRRLEAKVTRFDMALTPEDLGQVDVRLELADDGSLTARLHFDTPAAAAEMRAQADQLRRQLEQAGFQLARDALEFSHRDGSSPRQDGFERRPGRAFAAARDLTDAAEVAPLMNLSLSLGSARDRVDVKV